MSFSILFARDHSHHRATVEQYWLVADRDQIKTIVAMLVIVATIFFLSGNRPASEGIL